MVSAMFSNFKIWLHLQLHVTFTLLYLTYYFKQVLLMLQLQNLGYSLIASLVPSY